MWAIWKSKVPLNTRHFFYLVGRGRLPYADQLVMRKWKGRNEFCKLCTHRETTDHILFGCSLAVFAWCVVKEALLLKNRPTSFWECTGVVWDRGKKRAWMVLIASFCWGLCLTRNDWVFKDILISSPLQVVYRSLSLA